MLTQLTGQPGPTIERTKALPLEDVLRAQPMRDSEHKRYTPLHQQLLDHVLETVATMESDGATVTKAPIPNSLVSISCDGRGHS
jgi:hypothetical protein